MNKTIGKYTLTLLFLLLLSGNAGADIKSTGGYSAPYFQADYIQDVTEFSASIINPALLYRVNQVRFETGSYRWGSINPFGLGDLGYQQFSFLFPIRLRFTTGVTVLGSGSEFITANLSSGQIKEGSTSQYVESWIIPHFAFKLLPWLSIGTNPKILVQNQFGRSSVGFGADLGFYATVFDHYRFGDLGVSLTFQDIVPAVVKWKHSSSIDSKDVMTTRFRGGLRYSVLNEKLVGGVEVVVDNLLQDMWSFLVDVSADSVPLTDTLTGDTTGWVENDKDVKSALQKVGRVSVHLKYELIPQLWLKVGWTNNNIPYIGFNFNVLYPLPEMINNLSVGMTVGYSLNERERGATSMLKIATDVGPTREQRESKRLYDRLVLEPMNAYNEAMRLYSAGLYWEASFAFGKVLALYPNFHLSDKATYYMGDCYSRLRMNKIARAVFKEALAEYTTSDVRANFLYGIEKLDYREGRYKAALKNHAFISNLYSGSDVRGDADYIAGQVHFINKNYSIARILLTNVKETSPSYKYALYTLAIIDAMNKKPEMAVNNLVRLVSDSAKSNSERKIVYAAYNKLGQLYYEMGKIKNAINSFVEVPEKSRYGDDALLGIAWSWIKVSRPVESIAAADRLIELHPNSSLLPETYLLRGYAYMLNKQYEQALESFNIAKEKSEKYYKTESDLSNQEVKLNNINAEFEPISFEIKKSALRKPTERILAERKEYEVKYNGFKKANDDYFSLFLEVSDNNDFFSRKEDISQDIEYAIAKVSRMLGESKEQEIIDKSIRKQKKLDSEIEKLQKKLKDVQ